MFLVRTDLIPSIRYSTSVGAIGDVVGRPVGLVLSAYDRYTNNTFRVPF